MSKGNIITVVVAILVVLGGAYYGFTRVNKEGAVATTSTENVATVDGVAIPRSDYDTQMASAIASYKSQGVNVDDPAKMAEIQAQVVDTLVNNEILNQATVKAGVKGAQTDIDAQYQALLAQAGGAEKLNEQLAAVKITDAQLRANIAKQLAIRAYILSKIDINSATTTPAEIQKFYDENVKGQKGAPAFKDIKDQINQTIIANKQQTLLNALITSLRATAKIELHLPKLATSTASTTSTQ